MGNKNEWNLLKNDNNNKNKNRMKYEHLYGGICECVWPSQGIFILGGDDTSNNKCEYLDIIEQKWMEYPQTLKEHRYYPNLFFQKSHNILCVIGDNTDFDELSHIEYIDPRNYNTGWKLLGKKDFASIVNISNPTDDFKIRAILT